MASELIVPETIRRPARRLFLTDSRDVADHDSLARASRSPQSSPTLPRSGSLPRAVWARQPSPGFGREMDRATWAA